MQSVRTYNYFKTSRRGITIVIIYYIFLIFFGTTKIFKFQIYYSNSHSLKEVIMIIKSYHIIKIGITQIIDNTPNPNFFFFLILNS